MCNLYSVTKGQAAIAELTKAMRDKAGNLPPQPSIFPDYTAPVVRTGSDGVRELVTMRWGMPSSQKALFDAAKSRAQKLEAKGQSVDFDALLRREPDGGTTNIRNVRSQHWKRWLGIEHRCVVPFTSFSEFNMAYGGDVWFALDDSRAHNGLRGCRCGRRRRTGFRFGDDVVHGATRVVDLARQVVGIGESCRRHGGCDRVR